MYRNIFTYIITTLLTITLPCFAGVGEAGEEDDTTGNVVRWFNGNPLERVTMRSYYLDTRYPTGMYTLVNSDGDVLNRGLTVFTEFSGYGSLLGDLSFSYRLQNKNLGGLRFKEISAKISRWGMSFEYGKKNTWIGNGYYGSLLLSNNAEPFQMIKFQTERPIRVRYIGEFDYKFINGWLGDKWFDLFAHRVTYRPASWFEFGLNQVIKYHGNFKWYEFFHLMTAKDANASAADNPEIAANTDMMASLDIKIRFNFLGRMLYPVTDGGMYFEYGGEDILAYWQGDRHWIGPFGFEFLGQSTMSGLYLATEQEEFRIEYAQNYRTISLFSSYADKWTSQGGKYNIISYGERERVRDRSYEYRGNILGHHMGKTSDNLYMHLKRTTENEELRFYYSLRRRDLVDRDRFDIFLAEHPEIFQNIGVEYRRTFRNISIAALLEWHRFENIDLNPFPLEYETQPRTDLNQFMIGFEMSYLLANNKAVAPPADFSWLDWTPITRVSFRNYYMRSKHPVKRYELVNSYGDVLEGGMTPFWNIEGSARAFDAVSLYYNFQADFTDRLQLKRASFTYNAGPVAMELARGSVWLGHGYYGSLLLSNHAEPFPLIHIKLHEPVQIPYIGQVQYAIFHGWPGNFNLVGHRLSYFPHPYIEIGGSKVMLYTEGKKLLSAPGLLFADPSVNKNGHRRDARGSIDVALHLPFLRDYLSPLVDGKIYFEYGGEELHSFWTTDGAKWVGPFGFEFVGVGNIMGIWLATERYEVRAEYAQNYRNDYLFSSVSGDHLWGSFSIPWYGAYGSQPYLNDGNIMGHHMGSHADVLFSQLRFFFDKSTINLSYSSRRRGLVERQPPHEISAYPEELNQFAMEFSREIWDLNITGIFMWNRYLNVDDNGNPLIVNPIPGRKADEFIVGFRVEWSVGGR